MEAANYFFTLQYHLVNKKITFFDKKNHIDTSVEFLPRKAIVKVSMKFVTGSISPILLNRNPITRYQNESLQNMCTKYCLIKSRDVIFI